MDVRKSNPNLTIRKKPMAHKRKPKPLTAKQKKKIEPSYPSTPQTWYPPYFYNTVTEVPRLIRHRDHNVRYYREQVRFFMKWRYVQMGLVKTCTDCGKEKAYSFFDRTCDTKKSTITRRSYCSKCRKKYNREYYLKNKERHQKSNADYYAANTEQSKLTMRKNYVYRTKGRVAADDFAKTICRIDEIQTTDKERD